MQALGITIPSWLSTAFTVVQTVGSVAGANQQAASIKAAARVRQQQAEHRAKQLRINAGQERASSQRAAIEERRRGRLAQSRALALGSASGGSSGDITDIVSELGTYSEYNALSALYEGEDRARLLESDADLSIYEGNAAVAAARQQAKNTRLGGYFDAFKTLAGSSLFDKYAPEGPQTIQGGTSNYWGR